MARESSVLSNATSYGVSRHPPYLHRAKSQGTSDKGTLVSSRKRNRASAAMTAEGQNQGGLSFLNLDIFIYITLR